VKQLGKEGVKNLIAVPVSFVSEHIETLEEMDMEYRELAEENGVENWRRTPAVNTDARFINDMADLVVESLQAPMLSLSEAMQTMDLMEDSTAGPLLSLKNNGLSSAAMNGLNSRVAMLGVLSTSILELLSGHHPIVHMVGLK
jgi:ferrochelatase